MRTIGVCMVAGALLVGAPSARALGVGSIDVKLKAPAGEGTVEGTRGEFQGSPGSDIRGLALSLQNDGDKPVEIALDPVDAETASNFGVGFSSRETSPIREGKWIRLSERTVTLKPRETRSVGFTISVPSAGGPGDYVMGISVFERRQDPKQAPPGVGPNQAALGVHFVSRVVSRILVSVPGRTSSDVVVSDADIKPHVGGVQFGANVKNDGNRLIKDAHVEYVVTLGKAEIGKGGSAKDWFLPGTAVRIETPTSFFPSVGDVFSVKGAVRWDEDRRTVPIDAVVRWTPELAEAQRTLFQPRKTGSPEWLKWAAIGGAIALFAALGALGDQWRRRRLRPAPLDETLALLEAELESVGDSEHSLSLVSVSGVPTKGRAGRRVVRTLRSRLRPTDVLCELDEHSVLGVVAPGTTADAASGIGTDVRTALEGLDGVSSSAMRVGVATVSDPTTPADLIERATRGAG